MTSRQPDTQGSESRAGLVVGIGAFALIALAALVMFGPGGFLLVQLFNTSKSLPVAAPADSGATTIEIALPATDGMIFMEIDHQDLVEETSPVSTELEPAGFRIAVCTHGCLARFELDPEYPGGEIEIEYLDSGADLSDVHVEYVD